MRFSRWTQRLRLASFRSTTARNQPTDPLGGAGIARAGDKSATASGSFDFHGNVYSAASSKLRFDIGVEDGRPKELIGKVPPECRSSLSGASLEVVMSYCEATEARRFKASPVRLMLRDPKFRAAIGYDERRDAAKRLTPLCPICLSRPALSERHSAKR